MSIDPTTSRATAASAAATNIANGAIGSASDAERALEFQKELKAQILDKGIMSWAKDQWKEKLEARLRKEVMADMDLTDAQLTSMEETLRHTIEQMIQQQIEKKMQDTLASQNGPGGLGDAPQDSPSGVASGGISGKPTLSLPALTMVQGWGG